MEMRIPPSAKDYIFLEAVQNPAPPAERLVAALRRHEELRRK